MARALALHARGHRFDSDILHIKTDCQASVNKRELLLIGFVLLTVMVRLLPHPPNFTPVTALALFGGVTFQKKWMGVSLPLVAMILSDLYLGFYSISLWVYSSFLLIGVLGTFMKKVRFGNIIISSLLFFLITNFGVWLGGYPKTWEGFVLCYTLAIPFFVNSIIGDLFYSYLLKFSFGYSERKLMARSTSG